MDAEDDEDTEDEDDDEEEEEEEEEDVVVVIDEDDGCVVVVLFIDLEEVDTGSVTLGNDGSERLDTEVVGKREIDEVVAKSGKWLVSVVGIEVDGGRLERVVVKGVGIKEERERFGDIMFVEKQEHEGMVVGAEIKVEVGMAIDKDGVVVVVVVVWAVVDVEVVGWKLVFLRWSAPFNTGRLLIVVGVVVEVEIEVGIVVV